jgi:hypothetical protein
VAIRDLTPAAGNPEFIAVQLAPALDERNRAVDVPAKMFPPLTAMQRTYRFVSPVFTGFHVVPLSVERNIPAPFVPAKRLPLLSVRQLT